MLEHNLKLITLHSWKKKVRITHIRVWSCLFSFHLECSPYFLLAQALKTWRHWYGFSSSQASVFNFCPFLSRIFSLSQYIFLFRGQQNFAAILLDISLIFHTMSFLLISLNLWTEFYLKMNTFFHLSNQSFVSRILLWIISAYFLHIVQTHSNMWASHKDDIKTNFFSRFCV